MLKVQAIASAVRKRFYDNFTRTNTTGSLGTATDGSLWRAIRGVFTVSSNKATGDTTSYPIAAQSMPFQNAQVEVNSTSQGSGAAIWVTDSGNWWAVGVDTGAGYGCSCTTNYSYSSCAYYAYNCSGGNSYTYYYFQSSNASCGPI